MNRHSPERDLTAMQRPVNAGHPPLKLKWLKCGCHVPREKGARMMGNTPWRCAACVKAKAAE